MNDPQFQPPVTLSPETYQKVVGYLVQRPFVEVVQLLNELGAAQKAAMEEKPSSKKDAA